MKQIAILLIFLPFLGGCKYLNRATGTETSHSFIQQKEEVSEITALMVWQSNATAPKETHPPYVSYTGDVQMTDGNGFLFTPSSGTPATDGITWGYLGDILSTNYGIKSKFILIAVGGSDSNQWRNMYYTKILNAIDQYNPNIIIAIGGESDYFNGVPPSDTYDAWREIVIKTKERNRHIQWYMPLNSCIYGDGKVREAQQRLINDGYCRQGPDIDKIKKPEWMGPKWLHFDGQGFVEHAKLWESTLSKYYN